MDQQMHSMGMIDRESGEVSLMLFPFFLERLHGAYEEVDLRHESGLHYPLIQSKEPVNVTVAGGMGRQALLAAVCVEPTTGGPNRPSLSVAAYAWTCFGWADPHFWIQEERLASINLMRLDPDDGRVAMLRCLVRELGDPNVPVRKRGLLARVLPIVFPQNMYAAEWSFAWGRVALFQYGGEPEINLNISVSWEQDDTREKL